MSIVSFGFIIFAATSAFVFHLRDRVGYRNVVLLAVNSGFLLALVGIQQLWAILAMGGLGYLALLSVKRFPGLRALLAWIVLLVGLFVYLKQYAIVSFAPPPQVAYATLGLSYILFRIIHLVLEAREEDGPMLIGPLNYFNYLFSFTTLISGPIQRYPAFAAQIASLEGLPNGPKAYYLNIDRILNGVLKIVLISSLLTGLHQHLTTLLLAPGAQNDLLRTSALYAFVCVVFTLNIYSNFSGYMDIVCGVAAWFGFRLPENFDSPFKAANLLDFWGRWHITLSSWFRDYLFTPLMRRMTEWLPGPRWATLNGVVALFVSFSLMGIWHGTTTVFLLYGLMLGAGVSLTWCYQRTIRKLLGKARYRELAGSVVYIYLGRGFTFAYFAVALTCFWADWPKLAALVQNLSVPGFALAAFVLMIGAATTFAIMDRVGGLASTAFAAPLSALPASWPGSALLAVKLFVILQTAFLSGLSIPEFVYEIY